MKYYEIRAIFTIKFPKNFRNGSNKLECYIALGRKDMQGTNEPAYGAYSRIVKTAQGSYSQHFIFIVTYEQAK
jgi:hypothetical protein